MVSYPIPLTLLARLAVDQTEQGAGLGKALLKDAMKRFLVAHEQVGSRALLVHAADAAASDFYLKFGFQAASFSPLHLYLLPKDMHRALRKSTSWPAFEHQPRWAIIGRVEFFSDLGFRSRTACLFRSIRL